MCLLCVAATYSGQPEQTEQGDVTTASKLEKLRARIQRLKDALKRPEEATSLWPDQDYLGVLPLEAQAELNQAGVVCIADLAHRALIQPIFRQHEICVIEQVEELRAELHSLTLSDREILQNRKILVDEVRTN